METLPENKTAADSASVVNLGDVSEPVVNSPITGELIAIKPMRSLPKTHKHLIGIYPTAKGFTTEESGVIALHF